MVKPEILFFMTAYPLSLIFGFGYSKRGKSRLHDDMISNSIHAYSSWDCKSSWKAERLYSYFTDYIFYLAVLNSTT
jgi:hypothetical protein